MKKNYLLIIFLFIVISCKYTYKINVKPQDALIKINSNEISNNEIYVTSLKNISLKCSKTGYIDFNGDFEKKSPFGMKKIFIEMEKKKYQISINSLNGKSDVYINNKKTGETPLIKVFQHGIYDIILKRKDFPDQACRIEANSEKNLFFLHKKNPFPFKQIGVYSCGALPKQIIYSPDDKYIFIPLLDGYGFDVFNNQTLKIDKTVKPKNNNKTGFPEGLFIKEKKVFWVSQMTTGRIYEYSYPGLKHLRTLSTGGLWSKFMAWSDELSVVAVSNWSSNDVTIIKFEDGSIIKKIKTAQAPRGLAFSSDSKFLYITSFDGGYIYKINTKTWKKENTIYKKNAAMRHIVLSNDDKTAYVSNMMHAEVYKIDTQDFKIIKTYKVDSNPNTICLTHNNKYLFVSSRGPNSRNGYLVKSPRNGKIAVIDTKKDNIFFIEGGNQPTGLDLSRNNNYLCFSNFRENNLEIYWIGDQADK